jgi:hypothetical protein
MNEPLSAEELATLREWAAIPDAAVRFTSAEARRLLATLAATPPPDGLREALERLAPPGAGPDQWQKGWNAALRAALARLTPEDPA